MRLAIWSTNGRGGGGADILWASTARAARKRGWDVFVSLFDYPEARVMSRDLGGLGVEFHLRTRLPNRLVRAWNKFSQPYAAALRKFKPDVILINGGTLDWIRDDSLCAGLDALSVPYVTVSHLASGFLSADELSIAQRRLTQAAVTGFVSEALKRMCERHLAATLRNAVLINNPVNLRDTLQYPLPPPPVTDHLQMAMLSRINCYTKGHDYLLEALASPELRNEAIMLNIHGDGEHRAYVEKLASYYDLDSKVRFHGYCTDVAAAWRDAHIHVLPSITEGGPPIALVEAMLCGRPSVATRVGGVAEWIADGEEGFLAENAQPRNLVPAIRRALAAVESWPQMGLAAHQKAAAKLGHPVEDFIALLEDVAAGRTPAAGNG